MAYQNKPETHLQISFSKSVAQLQLVEDGNYIPSLLVTKPNNEWVDNDILTGTWAFK